MEAHAAEARQGTNADGKVMLQGRRGGREGERGREDGMSPISILTFRNDTEITQGFPISMAQLVGPHSINLPHFLLGLRHAEWNIEH